ncbi:hypothetical protein G6F51_001664 [Rhizopus arrhizus]|uniref:DH domain-containing protein n=1 Tax=Rhizopus oryzae TaxID=64495 RepID=A0A9P6YLQ7_RHIOR|nr:hypothetical protein G6F51_001664 [Rhizopus arrhizus]
MNSPESDKTCIVSPVDHKTTKRRPKSTDTFSSSDSGSTLFKKKFHFPSFRKQEPQLTGYMPEVPEPIVPSLIDWSSEAPLSPPPWESHQPKETTVKKRHSMVPPKSYSFTCFQEEDVESLDTEDDTDYHSDPELINNLSDMNLSNLSSDVTLNSTDTQHEHGLRRRSSCPDYDLTPLTTSTMVEKDILWITEQNTRHMSLLKKYTHPVDKKVAFKPCQKAVARAAEAAVSGNTISHHGPIYLHFCEETLRHLYIPNVFDPITREPILQFTNIKPRQYQLRRKTSWRKEAKGLMVWHDSLKELVEKDSLVNSHPHKKLEKYKLTRKFILREFYTTEVNFWNQLYYTKIVFYDALVNAINKDSRHANVNGADTFANLFDLMKFSAKLIHRFRHFQFEHEDEDGGSKTVSPFENKALTCQHSQLGKILCEMSEELVVFLRCALDYRENRKLLHHKAYEIYRQRLYSRKETSQFTMEDYLIIPIQRVARYGLLLADIV